MKKIVSLFAVSFLLLPLLLWLVSQRAFYKQQAAADLNLLLSHDYAFISTQLVSTAASVSKTSYPDYTGSGGTWGTSGASGWTSGFFPGLLWLEYQKTNDPAWRTKAESWTAGLESQKNNTGTHDVGFIMFSSFGNGYRLTNNQSYKTILLTAAGSLATRYSPVVKAIKSWNAGATDYQVIIDNMMNLELLFWAAKNGGQAVWYDIAVNHAVTTMNNHIRPDGSVWQFVNFNPTNGAVQLKTNKQGYSSSSTWSRGQAWAVHGFTIAYRETQDPRFLATAEKTADYYITHLPTDFVPYWDFQAPNIPNEPRDTSSAAIAASGLIELSSLELDSTRKQTYMTAAQNILASLSSASYLAEGTSNKALLLHGTGNKPSGNFDTGVIYGDYYFLLGLIRYQMATGVILPTLTTIPSIITPSSTPKPSVTSPSPTSIPTVRPTVPVTPTVTVKPSPTLSNGIFSLLIGLHGIGNGGDNVTPNGQGTSSPLLTQRAITIDVFNSSNQLVKSVSGTLTYQNISGFYTGNLAVGVPGGIYTITARVERYLAKHLQTIISVSDGRITEVPQFSLITGDANLDGKLSVLDYNTILDCFSELTPAKNCSDKVKKELADLTDDGIVNQFDYNLFLRELSVQPGQ